MAESIIVVKLGGTEGVDFSAICSRRQGIIEARQATCFCAWRLCGGECTWRRTWHTAEDDHFAFGLYITLY